VQLLAAAVVSASFAVANYAPRRVLPTTGLAGAAGWGTALLLEGARLSGTLAVSAAAVAVGLTAYAFSRRQRVPALVYVAAGIVPLLPGLTIYRGMRRFAEGDSLAGITLLGIALSTGLALAAGAILGEFLVQPRRRDVPRRERRTSGPRLASPLRRRRPS
jgi:uncharacterized membrane protein YjjB (DUF3815 family)